MKTTVNTRMRALREALKMTQSEFADALNISSALVGKMENGVIDVSDNTISKACQAFSVPIEWLEHGKGEMSFRKTEKPRDLRIFDPARDTLYNEMKTQISFMQQVILQLTGGKGNFLPALNVSGLHSKRRHLSATA